MTSEWRTSEYRAFYSLAFDSLVEKLRRYPASSSILKPPHNTPALAAGLLQEALKTRPELIWALDAGKVLERAETACEHIGALRLRLAAGKNAPASDFRLKDADGRYLPDVLLDLDYWALVPRLA